MYGQKGAGRQPGTTSGQHSFAQVPSANIQRSAFDRSCGLKTTFNGGFLIPIFLDEALPGDTMSLQMSGFARLATPIHPIMDNLYFDTHFFSVPYRLIWDNWQKFNGEQEDPGDSTDFLIPTVTHAAPGWAAASVGDYFGLPVLITDLEAAALHFRAMNLIWNEWFRDENLQDSLTVPKDDGPDASSLYTLLRRGKRHDYFTSSLPFPQKGPSVELPLGTSAPVVKTGTGIPLFDIDSTGVALKAETGAGKNVRYDGAEAGSDQNLEWDTTSLVADLTSASAANINAIREAFQIQKLFERDARGGTRYTEIIRSHFGVVSPDQRLQRPEYLGGGSSPVLVTEVPQTSRTETGFPQGELAGYGTMTALGHGFNKSFVEHCVIIGFCSVRADLNYQQGMERMWNRRTRFDFYWPAFQGLGEQAVLNKEIYADGSANDDLAWGYQERFAEYRYKTSKITGQMRSSHPVSLDTWHLAQDFATLPVLGDTFIQETPPIDRISAIQAEPDLLLDCYFKYTSVRPMPTYGVPGQMDRF